MDQSQIYQEHPERYHALVSAEDCDLNLLPALQEIVPLRDRTVVEVGAGTGRITRLLLEAGARVIATEREPAMLDVARASLGRSPRLELLVADASSLPLADGRGDIGIAGWVFGHLRLWLPEDWKDAIGAAIGELSRTLAPGATVIIIETLGTGQATPGPPSEDLADYYRWLEDEQGFQRQVIRTDYLFGSVAEAASTLGFFFGSEMADRIRFQGWKRVPEHTGIWFRRQGDTR